MSVEVSCDLDGAEEFQVAMQRFDAAMQNQVYRFLVSWAADVKAAIMRRAPVLTGHLRSTVYATIKDWVVYLGADATYSFFRRVWHAVHASTSLLLARNSGVSAHA